MRKRNVSVLLLVVLCVASMLWGLSSCKDEKSTQGSSQKTAVSLRLLWVNQAQFAGYYAAKEGGVFDAKGLNVQIEPGGPDINAVKLVGSGAEAFGICSATDIIMARSQGIPVRALAIIVKENPTCFFARADSKIRKVEDFRGKRVGVKVGREVENYLKAMLAYAHVPESEVQEVPIQFDMKPFFSGQVDVWCGYRINEPNIARAQGIEVTEILPGDYGVVAAGDVLFTSEAYYNTHPEVCRNFVDAAFEGWQSAKANREQAIGYVLKYNPEADKAHERRMLDSMIDLVFARGRTSFHDQTEAEWQAMLDFVKKYETVSPQVKASECFWALK